MSRSFLDYVMLWLKGLGMGAADVVPGVSGGTIAFISGIYEEFIDSIKSVDLAALKVLFKEGIGAFWKKINGWFLVAIFSGIGTSIVSLAKLISYLLENHPVLLWSFFFGLIIASVIYVGKSVKKWNAGVIVALLFGAGLAFWITTLEPPVSDEAAPYWYIILSGAIAICAMILPGISGSFILVLLGTYGTVLGAVSDKNFTIIGLFALGAIIGLVTFSRVLSWLFKKWHDLTIGLLTGFLIGSLNKIWPWKDVEIIEIKGHEQMLTSNVLPGEFDGDPQMLYAILLMVAGLGLIFGLEALAKRKPAEEKA